MSWDKFGVGVGIVILGALSLGGATVVGAALWKVLNDFAPTSWYIFGGFISACIIGGLANAARTR